MCKILFNSPSHASSSGSATGCESNAQVSAVSIEADRPAVPAYYYYCAGWPLFSTITIRLFALDFYEVIVDSAIVVYYDSALGLIDCHQSRAHNVIVRI